MLVIGAFQVDRQITQMWHPLPNDASIDEAIQRIQDIAHYKSNKDA